MTLLLLAMSGCCNQLFINWKKIDFIRLVAIAEVQDAPVMVYEDEIQGFEELNEEQEDEKSIH
jgi:hypothetical protein